jgi:DNA-directed RNA polymerase subunit M/transcription elongation factor TFIIS
MEFVEDDNYLREKGVEALKTFLSKSQNIKTIENAVYQNGKNYLLNMYEIINEINSGNKLNTILKDIKNNKLDWKCNYLKEYIYEEEEQDNFIVNPFEVEEGVLECKCGSKRVYSYAKQTRGGDESTSTFAECMGCKAKWVYSG